MSGGLAPSKSTVYVGNLPFSLTNNDLHKIFEKYGKVVKVTVVKDRENRRSKGVAFVLYLDRDSAHTCIRALNGTQLFGRTLKCSLATDNGRASEFIRRKIYKDKTRCYECGDFGHVSYKCPKNALGDRQPPKKKEKRRKEKGTENVEEEEEEEEEEDEESLGAAIRYEQQLKEKENYGQEEASMFSNKVSLESKRKKFKKNAYFSDEEEEDD